MTWSASLPALAGALAQEVLHWYLLRARLDEPRLVRLLRSPAYWIVTLAMIAVSAVGAAFLSDARTTPATAFVLGAAFPALLERLVAAAVTRAAVSGADTPHASWWRDWLGTA